MIFVGIVGAYSISMPIFETSAVSEDASVWDGENVTDITENDFYVILELETAPDSSENVNYNYVVGDQDGNGSYNYLYYIYTARGLKYFSSQVASGNTYAGTTVYLCVDIDLNNMEWTPIGTLASGNSTSFAGTFDGQGYSIYNLQISGSYNGTNNYGQRAGFFSSINSATIQNLSLVDVNISYYGNNTNVGGIAGSATNSSISNCSVSGVIDGTNSNATYSGMNIGGIVGSFNGSTSNSSNKIANSRNLANISGRGYVGGIAGYTQNGVTIEECYNEGTISGENSAYAGGLVGYSNPNSSSYCLHIKYSYNAGQINLDGFSTVGGLLGYSTTARSSYNTYFAIERSYNRGNFVYESASISTRIGGLVGYAGRPNGWNSGSGNSSNLTFSRVFNTGKVIYSEGNSQTIPNNSTYSEIINVASGAAIIGCEFVYYDPDYTLEYTNPSRISSWDTTSSNYTSYNNGSATLVEVSQLADKFRTANFGGESFLGENINNIKDSETWNIQVGINGGYPYLKNTYNINNANNDVVTTVDSLWEGEGTKESPYLIYTAADLARVAEVYNSGAVSENGTFVFNGNNSLSGETVGSSTITYFSLQNDIDLSSRAWTPIGNGRIIDTNGNEESDEVSAENQFRFINAVFDGNNFTISGINCSLQANYDYLGLFGYVENSIIRNVKIDDFRFIGTNSSTLYKATLVAYLSNSYVINCADYTAVEENDTAVSTISAVNGTSYIVYGDNNLNDSIYNANLYAISDLTGLNELYLTYIDTNGGTVYDTVRRDSNATSGEVSVHIGQAELLVDSSLVNSSYNIHSGINTQFGYSYLENLPYDINLDSSTTSLIGKEGYQISGYSCNSVSCGSAGDKSLTGVSSAVDLITNGILANWSGESISVEVEVVYNAYEASYGTYNLSEQSLTLTANYNEFYSNTKLQEVIMNLLEENNIEREGYEIVGIYTGFKDHEFLGANYLNDGVGLFIGENEKIYIEWGGVENYSISLSLSDVYYNYNSSATVSSSTPIHYSWSEAVESVIVKFYGTDGSEQSEELDLTSDIINGGSVAFNYLVSLVDKQEEKIEIEIVLKEGFSFDSESTDANSFLTNSGFVNNRKLDSNSQVIYNDYINKFGFSNLDSNYGNLAGEYTDKNSLTIDLQQIVGNGNLKIGIGRSSWTYDVIVDQDIYFGLTLSQQVQSPTLVYVLSGSGFVSLSNVSSSMFNSLYNNPNSYLGINLFDGYFIASTEEYDMVSEGILGTSESDGKKELIINIQDTYGVNHYYLITLTVETVGTGEESVGRRVQTIYSISGNSGVPSYGSYVINDRLVAMTEGFVGEGTLTTGTEAYHIDYYTNSNFGIVFSAESDDAEIVQKQGDPTYLIFNDTDSDGEYDEQTEELRKLFYDMSKPDGRNGTKIESYLGVENITDKQAITRLEILQTQTTISFDFKFVTLSGNTEDGYTLIDISNAENLPQINITVGNSEGTLNSYSNVRGVDLNINDYTYITFEIQNTDYYMWSFREGNVSGTIGKVSGSQSSTDTSYKFDNLTYSGKTLFVTPIDNGVYSDNIVDPEDQGNIITYNPANEDQLYFTYSDPGQDGLKYNFNFTMNFPVNNLFPIDFDIMFVAEEVNFNIEVESQFYETNSSSSHTDSVNSTTISLGSGSSSDSLSLKASDNFTVTTNPTNKGYTFSGFRVVQVGSEDNYTSFPPSNHTSSGNTTISMSMEEFLSYYKQNYTTLSTSSESSDYYQYKIVAVYVSKSVRYQATFSKFLISDYNGTGEYYISSGIGLGTINASLQDTDTAFPLSGTYYYHSADQSQLDQASFTFALNSSNYYEFTGFAVLTEDAYGYSSTIMTDYLGISKVPTQEQNFGSSLTVSGSKVSEYLRGIIASSDNYLNKTFYIVPVLRQKTLEITITSGVDNVSDTDSEAGVYDSNIDAVETTSTKITIKFYYVSGTSVNFSNSYIVSSSSDLENVNEENNYILTTDYSASSLILNDVFNRRVGYSSSSWTITYGGGTRTATTSLSLASYYNTVNNATSSGSDYAISIERRWTANTFAVNYYSGDSRYNTILEHGDNEIYGTATGTTATQTGTYDQSISLSNNGFSLVGYDFDGWRVFVRTSEGDNLYKDYKVNEDGVLGNADITNIITGANQILGESNYGLSLQVYALWTPKEYNITLNANGGKFVVDGTESEELTLQLTYNRLFSTATLNGQSVEGLFNESANNYVIRTAFYFDGFYVANESTTTKESTNHITLNTYLRNNILTFNDSETCLTLYATWRYDTTLVTNLTFNTSVSEDYTGEQITVGIYEFTNITTQNLILENTESLFNITYGNAIDVNPNYGIGVEFSFSSENVSLDNISGSTDGTWTFTVGENVGQYIFILSIGLYDEASTYYNIGLFNSISSYFIINIERAEVGFVTSSDNSIWLENIKYLVSQVGSSEEIAQFDGYQTFDELVNDLSLQEGYDFTNELAYEYLFMKYYNMINTKNSSYHTFKNWSFIDEDSDYSNDYFSYYEGVYYFGGDENTVSWDNISAERQTRAEILANSMFVFSYDFENLTSSYVFAGSEDARYSLSSIILNSTTASSVVSTELTITSIEVYSSSNMIPNYSYEIRAYVQESSQGVGKIGNYALSQDSGGNYYISLGNSYMLIQVLKLMNNSLARSTFYNGEIAEVSWLGSDQESHSYYDGSSLYQIEAGSEIYISLDITTSNEGSSDVDTIFNFYDAVNYFNISNLRVCTFTGSSGFDYINYLSYFNVILDESFEFTIYNVVDTARILLESSYFTLENGLDVNTDLPEEFTAGLENGLFSIMSFTYSIDSASTQTVSLSDDNGTSIPLTDGQYLTEDNILLFTLENNNSLAPTFYTSAAVVSVDIKINSLYFGDYIRYYNILNELPTEVNTYATTTEFTLVLKAKDEDGIFQNTITYEDGEITDLNYYGVYSDLVRVNYDMNLPGVENSTFSLLKLGESTVDYIIGLTYSNLIVSDMRYTLSNGTELSYTNLFDSTTGLFVGANVNNPYAPITLVAYWMLDEISMSVFQTEFHYAVGSVNSFYANIVGAMENDESSFFNYNYELYKGDTLLASNSDYNSLLMTFENGGSVEDSGTYTFRVTVTIKDNYSYILDSSSLSSVSNSLDFTIEFHKNRLTNLEFISTGSEITYDGLDHINSFTIRLSYSVYDASLGDYSEEVTTASFQYGASSLINISITKNGEIVSAIDNVGTYSISVTPNSDFFDFDSEQFTTLFTYIVNRYNIDLSDSNYNLNMSKNFNTEDPDLASNFRIANQTVTFNLYRNDLGEDIGEYDLYLSSFSSLDNNNFTVSLGETVLFDGTDYSDLTTTPVGTFSIVKTGDLRLYWQVTDTLSNTIPVYYSEYGYSVSISDGNLLVISNEVTEETITLTLYDIAQGQVISSQTILNIILPLLNDIEVSLSNYGVTSDIVYNSANYSFNITVPENAQILNYFSNVVFSQDYTLQIMPQTLSLDDFTFSKEYDGENIIYLDLDNNIIEDIDTYQGIYLEGTFSDTHVGENIRVQVRLLTTDESSYILTNYQLSGDSTYGEIEKRQATINFTISYFTGKNQFNYGDLTYSNLQGQISFEVIDGEEDLTTLFESSYYTLNYSLTPQDNGELQTNAQGYIYAGTYTLDAQGEYQDFDLTENLPTIEILPYDYEIELTEGYITEDAITQVYQFYTLDYYVGATGDSFQVNFYVPNSLVGTVGQFGDYNLSLNANNDLYENVYSNGNINVIIDENNTGFKVASYEGTLYLQIDDNSILTRPYNALTYTITANETTFIITIENEDDTYTVESEFSFWHYVGGELVELDNSSLNFESISITSQGTNQFSSVGSYRLNLSAEATGYENVSFITTYNFIIQPKEITVTAGMFDKIYDGTTTVDVAITDGVFEGDEVIVRGIYSDANAGENKSVRLTLSGTSSQNYTLTSSTTTGTISKKDATISLVQDSFQYGEISVNSNLSFEVSYLDDENNAVIISSGLYTVTSQIIDYAGVGYLPYSETPYIVNIIVDSQNFNISPTALEFTIAKRQLNFNFTSPGVYMTSYGSEESLETTFVRDYTTTYGDTISIEFTRSAGTEVAYYRVTGASIYGSSGGSNNYYIGTVTDNVGAYRIVSSSSRIYLLASDENVITDYDEGILLEFQYDGNSYDSVNLTLDEENQRYILRIYNSQDTSIRQEFELNLYTYDELSNSYIKLTSVFDTTINATSFSINDLILNSGNNYYIYNSDAASENFTVKLGKDNSLYTFQVNVQKRNLYFNQSVIERQFDNQNAVVYYADANDILTNIVNGETFSLNITFYNQDGSVAVYAGENYNLVGEIIGSDNYQIVYTLSDQTTTVSGTITKAPISIVINSQTVIYGDATTQSGAVEIAYQFSSETIDLTQYEKLDEMSFEIILWDTELDSEATYSTSNYLNAKTYEMRNGGLVSDDFYIEEFICDTISGINLVSTYTVLPRTLSIAQTDEELETIFTKYYDNSTTANIFAENGELRFDVSGKIANDVVDVESGNYLSSSVGTNIEVTFTLTGADADNYALTSYTSGVINPITIHLNYNKGGETDEENGNITSDVPQGTVILERLNYPFVYSDSLTSNSQDSNTMTSSSFPSSLSGKVGHVFSHWSLDFEVEENSTEYNFLSALANELNITSSYNAGVFSLAVGNNRATVNLLNRLLSDENDYFNLYYLGQEEIEITFNAVWTTETYDVTVTTLKDGVFTIDYANTFINGYQKPAATFQGTYAYGSTLTILVDLNEHIKVARFYNRNTNEDYVNGGNITITTTYDSVTNTSETTFVVASLSSDMNIGIELSYKDVSITLDLTNYPSATIKDDRFEANSIGRYVWTTSYEDILGLTLETLPAITNVGFVLQGYTFTGLNDASSYIESDAFYMSELTEFIFQYADATDYEIVYTPVFDERNVNVVLNYNYDENYQNDESDNKVSIQVPYQGTFGSSDEWIDTPLREGYNFIGWFTNADSEVEVTGDSIVDSTATIILYARWEIQQNTVYLTFDNMTLNSAQIDGENVSYTSSGSTYILNNLTFNETLVLEFTLDTGFNISNVSYHYLDGEDVSVLTFSTNGNIGNVEFTIPAQPEVYLEVESGLNQNTISFSGEHISGVTATDSAGNILEVEEDFSFVVETNVDVTIEVAIEQGYVFTGSSLTQNFNQTYDEERNVLIIELFNINSAINIEIETQVRLNTITINFENPDHNLQFVVNNIITTANTFEVNTGESFAFYTNILHGYRVSDIASTESDTEISISKVEDSSSLYNGYYYVIISNIYSDLTLTVNTERDSFTVNIQTVSFDENGNRVESTNNTAFINGMSEATLLFESEAELSAFALDDYRFAGFSTDSDTFNIFSNTNPTTYIVEDNVTIYAVFSKIEYNLTLLSYNYYQLDSASGSEGEVYETLYQQIFYINESRTQTINQLTLYYGSSVTLYLTIPDGYNFYGLGYYEMSSPNDKTYIVNEETSERYVEVYISYTEFINTNFRDFIVFAALSPLEVEINVSSWLDYDGIYEEDNLAGNISLVNENGDAVNENGYVTGTNNHYSSSSFNGGLLNVRDFVVISYSNSSIYLKIFAERDGYYFTNVTASSGITINSLGQFGSAGQTYYLYQFAGFVGGNSVDIQIYFKPEKKIIDYNFVNENGDVVNGGNLSYRTDTANSFKVWSDGTNFASMKMTAFIDSTYTVVAYVRLGFVIDETASFITFDESVVSVSNITFEQILAENTYYTYIITFDVSGYVDNSQISINLVPQTYTVLLRDTSIDEEESDVLVEIQNVKFHEMLDLSEDNAENLIFDEEVLSFTSGYLNIVQTKDDYNFGGYFTLENGQGTQYINASGQATLDFMETGYILDEQNNIYVLSQNAQIIDGQVVISLYLYWIYLKTQITFSIIPDIIVNIDAEDIVQGIDEYNSWFNENYPLYLEVAFDTNITFTAPELSGYSFYRFVIRQRDANGNWLTDVVSYQESVPWSTNEYDRIVEVEVQIYYFARVDVILYGGDMEYEIRQVTDDGVARTLVSEGYVDTTREFILVALDSDGYTFQYWINVNNNMRYNTQEITLTINERTSFFLYCQGKTITLRFDEYDATYGQISILQIDARSGGLSARSLGTYRSDGTFVKTTTSVSVRVGDTLTFLTSIEFGYGAEWNIDGIELSRMDENYYYFTVTLDEEYAEQTIQVIPTFSGETVAFYINQDFAIQEYLQNATDNNNASSAGYFVYNGETVDVVLGSIFTNINIDVVVNMRYAVSEISISSNRGVTIDVTDHYNSETGVLSFTSEFLTENQIAGTLILEVLYERLYFTAQDEFTENGVGTEDNPYLISSIDDLTYYMEKINEGAENSNGLKYSEANYLLETSLNLAEKFWTPIGTEENPFNGTFNFNGYTITSIYLARIFEQTSYGGLFGVLGEDANIYLSTQDLWYVFVIVGVAGLLIILLVILLIWNKRKKKKREELERR